MDINELKIVAYNTSGQYEKDFIEDIFQTAMTGKNFLELGTGHGSILMPLAIAAQANNGKVITIDKLVSVQSENDVPNAKEKLKTFGLDGFVNFIQSDDREEKLLGSFENEFFDVIAIDTSHEYYHTLTELVCYSEKLKHDGYFILHDTGKNVNKPIGSYGARKAVETFLKHYDFLIIKNIDKGAGLMILKKW